jgi:uncharacterized protein
MTIIIAEKKMSIITLELLSEIKAHYCLDWYGTHGVIHWSRVYENGMKLAEQPGVNKHVVQLFSVFHDSQRKNENGDKDHGKRGAQLARNLRTYCSLDEDDFSLLTIACEIHTSAKTHDEITIQACLDADRLDLGRVGITPNPHFLSTPLAKMPGTIAWGLSRSRGAGLPDSPFGLIEMRGKI